MREHPELDTTVAPLDGVSSSGFEGVFTAPENTADAAATYAITISALDDIGQQTTVDAGTVTVAAPPPPVAEGRLVVSPASRSFGPVRVGSRARESITLRNTARRSINRSRA